MLPFIPPKRHFSRLGRNRITDKCMCVCVFLTCSLFNPTYYLPPSQYLPQYFPHIPLTSSSVWVEPPKVSPFSEGKCFFSHRSQKHSLARRTYPTYRKHLLGQLRLQGIVTHMKTKLPICYICSCVEGPEVQLVYVILLVVQFLNINKLFVCLRSVS